MTLKRHRRLLISLLILTCSAIWGNANASSQIEEGLVPVLSASTVLQASSSSDLGRSLLQEIGIAALRAGLDSAGSRIPLGLVDTGVDPAVLASGSVHTLLDLTSEGRIRTSEPLRPDAKGIVLHQGVPYAVAGIASQGHSYRVGTWTHDGVPRSTLNSPPILALEGIKVVLAAPYLPGQYDTVYIDTDRDGDFSDEIPLEKFSNTHKFASIKAGTGSLSVGVAEIGDGGSSVTLFFDANGHGTQLASVIVGAGNDVPALAPQTSLIAVKAINSAGESSWDLITRGIQAACEQGAKIVVVGASPASCSADARKALSDVLSRYRQVLVIMSAGNRGPGVGTLAATGRSDNLLVVGGYIPESVTRHLGWGSSALFYPWSSVGPDADGNVPSVLCVAVAPAAAPAWVSGGSLSIIQGTSVSAAYAGGIAAAVANGLDPGFADLGSRVRRAIEESAAPLPGLTVAEQGHGIIRPDRALALARSLTVTSRTRIVYKWGGGFFANALFDRDKVPGTIPITIDNLSANPLNLTMTYPSWITVPYSVFGVAPVDQRHVNLTMKLSSPGFHSGYIVADDPMRPGREVESVVSAVVPSDLSSGLLGVGSLLGAGEIHREFLRIEPGMEALEVRLTIRPWAQGSYGRARLYIYDEAGRCAYQGAWVGSGADGYSDVSRIPFPSSGVWEVVVLSDPALGATAQAQTSFGLECRTRSTAVVSGRPVARKSSDSSALQSRVSLVNYGSSLKAAAQLLVDGVNGFYRQGRVQVTPGVSATIQLPRVEPGTTALVLSMSAPTSSSASLTYYLYGLDTATGQWKQVASARSDSRTPGQMVLANPAPGQYVAYVETVGDIVEGTSFSWIALAVRPNGTGTDMEPSGGVHVDWRTNEQLTVQTKAPLTSGLSHSQYLLVWDSDRTVLRNIVPIDAEVGEPTLLVTWIRGATLADRTYLTVRAWDQTTMRPVDACVEVDGVWHQLTDGHAVISSTNKDLSSLSMRGEYPGMTPWTFSRP